MAALSADRAEAANVTTPTVLRRRGVRVLGHRDRCAAKLAIAETANPQSAAARRLRSRLDHWTARANRFLSAAGVLLD